MRKITFKGSQSERAVYAPVGLAASIKRALEARGYATHMNSGEVSPWQEIEAPDHMIAVQGKLTRDEKDSLLFLVGDEATMDDVWEAIRVLFPRAITRPMQVLNRPA